MPNGTVDGYNENSPKKESDTESDMFEWLLSSLMFICTYPFVRLFEVTRCAVKGHHWEQVSHGRFCRDCGKLE